MAKEIDAGTITVYKKLGAEYGGWIQWDSASPLSFVSESERADYDYPPSVLPGFHFRKFPQARLPRVAVPFGLMLANSNATNEDIEQLGDLDNLVLLDLRYTPITDAGLKGLAGFDKLTTLLLDGKQVSAAGINHLAGLRRLESPEMSSGSLDEAAFKALGSLKNLRSLRCRGGGLNVRPAWIKHLAGLKLHTLELNEVVPPGYFDAVSEIGLLHALLNAAGKNGARPNSADEVVSLGIGGDLKPADLSKYGIFKNLTSLQIQNVEFGSASKRDPPSYGNLASLVKDVAKFEKLTEIDFGAPLNGPRANPRRWGSTGSGFQGNYFSGVGLSELARLKNVVSLNLNTVSLTRGGFKDVATLTNLTRLYVGETGLSDADLKTLASLTRLTALNLQGTRVTNAGIKQVACFKNLTELSVGQTRVRDFGVRELSGLTNLAALDLSDTEVTDAALRELVGMKKLAKLNLLGTRTTDAGIAELQKALPNCKIER